MNPETPLDQIAARWLLRMQSARDTATAVALDGWLEASIDHRIAYAEAIAAWHGVAAAPLARPAASPRPSAWPRAGAAWLAASATMAMFVAVWLALPRGDFATPAGATAVHALADGSTLTLGTDSAVSLAFDAAQRRIVLDEGTLHVDVAKDPSRPLVVVARGVAVTAIGTRFAVAELSRDRRYVMVDEGIVSVRGEESVEAIELHAGQRVEIDDGRVGAPEPLSPHALAWMRGTLVYDGEPLHEALAELGRWVPGTVVCRAACDEPVRGAFPVARADAAIDALAAQRGLRVRRYPGVTVVGR